MTDPVDDEQEIEVRCGRTVYGTEDRISHEATCEDCRIVGFMCRRSTGCGLIYERRAAPVQAIKAQTLRDAATALRATVWVHATRAAQWLDLRADEIAGRSS